jgi:hypothetical protein
LILKKVGGGLFQSNSLQTSRGPAFVPSKLVVEKIENLDAKIFRGRDAVAKVLDVQVEMGEIESLQDLIPNHPVQNGQVDNHPRSRINLPGYGHLQHVVVPVAVRAVTLAVEALVFLRRERSVMESMRSGETIAPGQINHHSPK